MSYIDRIKLNAFETKIRENKNVSQNYVNNVNFNGQVFPFRENNSEYKYMSVTIDLTEPNPSKCCQYRDDALSMTAGSSDWDTFFGHFPCTLNETTKEVRKLNRDNFNKYINDESRDNSLDTMICFPLRGINIFKVSHYLTVSMTDNPNDEAYQYYAHTYNGIVRKNMYISAYKAKKYNNQILSQSNTTLSASSSSFTLSNLKTICKNKGFGYDAYGWYQYLYLQVMYILKYCNLDSQSVIGRGLVNSLDSSLLPVYIDITGVSDTYGMDSEIIREIVGNDFTYCTEDKEEMRQKYVYHSKLFGIEDLWGGRWTILDNIKSSNNGEVYISNTSGNTIENISYYELAANVPQYQSGWLVEPYGDNEVGFMPIRTTEVPETNIRFSDEVVVNIENKPIVYMAQGGNSADLCSAGIFSNSLSFTPTTSTASYRFCYFEN